MNKAQDGLYEIELRRVASRLDLGRTGNIEDKIIGHCLECLRSWVAVHGEPQTLSDLATEFATSLDMRITEVRNQDDIDASLAQRNTVVHPTRCPRDLCQQLRPQDRADRRNAMNACSLMRPRSWLVT